MVRAGLACWGAPNDSTSVVGVGFGSRVTNGNTCALNYVCCIKEREEKRSRTGLVVDNCKLTSCNNALCCFSL